MNKPPADGIRIDSEALRKLIYDIFIAVPVSEEHASIIAELMIDTDLRGVVSHGVMQTKRYYSDFRSSATNTNPNIRILREAASTVALLEAPEDNEAVPVDSAKQTLRLVVLAVLGFLLDVLGDLLRGLLVLLLRLRLLLGHGWEGRPRRRGRRHRPHLAPEQRHIQHVLEHSDLMTDRRRRHVHPRSPASERTD